MILRDPVHLDMDAEGIVRGRAGVSVIVSGPGRASRLRLLVVEHRADRNRALCAALLRCGFDVGHVLADSHLQDTTLQNPDVVVVDVGVLSAERLELCRRLRDAYQAPILALTVRADPAAWMAGFRAGVDDYVVKPYGMDEVVTRIGAVSWMRRPGRFGRQSAWMLADGRLVVDVDERTVQVNGAQVALTRKEFDLLVLLAGRAGVVLRREEILGEVWGEGGSGAERSLEVHVASLRSKLGLPGVIGTTRGVGYQFVDSGRARLAG